MTFRSRKQGSMDLNRLNLIRISISEERLTRYLVVCPGGISEAIGLYEYNCRLSEAFYTVLQGFEVCLRNHLHRALSDHFGDLWFSNNDVPLDEKARMKISTATARLRARGKAAIGGPMVAELSLGFWVALLRKRYDMPLWRVCMHTCFRSGGAKPNRFAIHQRCHSILQFRNRVAHHEPIWDQDLLSRHREIIEAIGWMCADTALWVQRRSRLPAVALDQ